MTDIDVLAYIQDYPGQAVPAADLAVLIGEGAKPRLARMRTQGLVVRADSWFGSVPGAVYRIGPAGENALSEFQQRADRDAQQRADEQRKQRADRVQAGIDRKQKLRHDLKVAAFGAVVTVALEHLPQIVRFAVKLFNALRFRMLK